MIFHYTFVKMFNIELVKDESYLAVECAFNSCGSAFIVSAPIK